jgi:hypothetical protein
MLAAPEVDGAKLLGPTLSGKFRSEIFIQRLAAISPAVAETVERKWASGPYFQDG